MARRKKSPLTRQEAQHLSRSILLEESGAPVAARVVIVILFLIFVAFTTWTYVAELDEVAVTHGTIEPAGRLVEVESESGGMVTAILVHDGQMVEAGRELIRLDPIASQSRLKEARGQEAALLIRKERLMALLEKRLPDFSPYVEDYHEVVDYQAKLHDLTLESLQVQQSMLESRVRQFEAELNQLDNTEKTLSESFELVREELATFTALHEKNLVGKLEFNNVRRLYLQTQEGLLAIPARRSQVNEMLSESRDRLDRLGIDARQSWLVELDRINEELARQKEVIVRAEQQSSQTVVRSPEAGFVHDLAVRSLGRVVQPGETILKIVPTARHLVAVTRIASKDIGHVHPGLPVTLKLVAFDFARYGAITGRLLDISPSTVKDATGEFSYEAIISLDRLHMGDDPQRNVLLPGMRVQADIRTGEKTVLAYLLKPIHTSLKQAFRER